MTKSKTDIFLLLSALTVRPGLQKLESMDVRCQEEEEEEEDEGKESDSGVSEGGAAMGVSEGGSAMSVSEGGAVLGVSEGSMFGPAAGKTASGSADGASAAGGGGGKGGLEHIFEDAKRIVDEVVTAKVEDAVLTGK